MNKLSDADSDTAFSAFLDIGLTGYHIEKAMRVPNPLPEDITKTLQILGTRKFNLGCKSHTMSLADGWMNVEMLQFGANPNQFLKSEGITDPD